MLHNLAWTLGLLFLAHEACRYNSKLRRGGYPTIPSIIIRLLKFLARWMTLLADGLDLHLKYWRERRENNPIAPLNEFRPQQKAALLLLLVMAGNHQKRLRPVEMKRIAGGQA